MLDRIRGRGRRRGARCSRSGRRGSCGGGGARWIGSRLGGRSCPLDNDVPHGRPGPRAGAHRGDPRPRIPSCGGRVRRRWIRSGVTLDVRPRARGHRSRRGCRCTLRPFAGEPVPIRRGDDARSDELARPTVAGGRVRRGRNRRSGSYGRLGRSVIDGSDRDCDRTGRCAGRYRHPASGRTRRCDERPSDTDPDRRAKTAPDARPNARAHAAPDADPSTHTDALPGRTATRRHDRREGADRMDDRRVHRIVHRGQGTGKPDRRDTEPDGRCLPTARYGDLRDSLLTGPGTDTAVRMMTLVQVRPFEGGSPG